MNPVDRDLSLGKAFRRRLFGLSVDREKQLRQARQNYRLLFSPKKQKTDDNSTAGVNADGDEEIDAFLSSFIPLQNEYILEMIANYLPNQDLKRGRLVCRLWGKEMARCLDARQTLVIADEQCPDAEIAVRGALRREIVSVGDLAFFDFDVKSQMFRKLIAAFGFTLSGLQFEECQISAKSLAELLTAKAPNLEMFSYEARASVQSQSVSTFAQIKSFLPEKDFCLPEMKKLYWNEEFGRVRLEEICKTCPNLIELIYKNMPVPNPRDFTRIRWDSLQILKLSPRDELLEDHYLSLLKLQLKLKTLSLSGVNPKGKGKMHCLKRFLKSLSSTLTELEIFQHFMSVSLSPPSHLSSSANKSEFKSPFPVKLPNLHLLNIDFCFLNSLTDIQSMENLNTLECRSKRVNDWKDLFPKGIPPQCPTIKSIRVGSVDSKCLKKFSRCFEACTNLELNGEHINDEAIRIIIKEFPHLEQFTVAKLPPCSELSITDSGLTGLPARICKKWEKQNGNYDHDYLKEKKFPAIYDLKRLCRLELCGMNSPLSDLAVLYGVAKCPDLIILGLPSCQMTDVSLKAIEEQLPSLGVFELQHCMKITNDGIHRLKSNSKLLFQYDILMVRNRDDALLE